MAIRSKIRDWIFPSKGDTFDVSYDYLLSFFNSLDSEFGGISSFLFDYELKYFFGSELDKDRQRGNEGDFALMTKTGDVLLWTGGQWTTVNKIGRLPKVNSRDPRASDILRYDEGDSWINSTSGGVFKFIGKVLVDETTDTYEALWVNREGNVEYFSNFVHQCVFYPKIDLSYKTKRLSLDENNELTFEDDLLHMSGKINSDGVLQYLEYDTHADIYIQDFLIGNIQLNREKIQTLMDMEYFNPEGGLPAHNDSEIYPWYERFERLLILLENSAQTDYNLKKTLKVNMTFSSPITEILEDETVFDAVMLENGYNVLSTENVVEMKEKYRSFFASLHFQEMSMVQKQWAMYLLGSCVAWEAYDGNIYYIDGTTMLADGNVEPTC